MIASVGTNQDECIRNTVSLISELIISISKKKTKNKKQIFFKILNLTVNPLFGHIDGNISV